MKKVEKIYKGLIDIFNKENNDGVTASMLSNHLNIHRSCVSRYLNQLYKEGKVEKIQGRPVLYKPKDERTNVADNQNKADIFQKVIGSTESLNIPIQQAKAAILYPPNGLHTLILGETGVGKTMFAELMYDFAKESKVICKNAPFVTFNCADYADNPQLLLGQLFGVKKGAYTGADKDKDGLLKKADGGILFLDEVHRLPPVGQEMLFTYMDKSLFRRLGDTENVIYSKVLIISATTENPQSYLLKTFTRRIPMIINLPSLEERSLKERLHLIEEFFKEESKGIGMSIYVDKKCLISLLLYDCPNNIGQLKGDIKLACAKAFLSYKSQNRDYILVSCKDLPQYAKKGIMKIKDSRKEVESILGSKGEILRFFYNEKEDKINIYDNYNKDNFYDVIENKVNTLKNIGIQEHEISQIVNINIENYFKKYMGDITNKLRRDEISKIVDGEILNIAEEILEKAEKKLNKAYNEKLYYSLALHLNSTVQRIREGHKIFNPKLNFIRLNYSDEFLVSMELAKIIESKLDIELPLDEIGYITMFLAADKYDEENLTMEDRVGILVIMHGNSTASSMVDVANRLVGEEHAKALDMPLNASPEELYNSAKEKVIEIDKGKGVLLMVDMGSLTNFGDMLYEDTGVRVMTIEMVSTLLVIEACRKAVIGRTLKEIYYSCINTNPYLRRKSRRIKDIGTGKRNVIVTACFTGEGAAERFKNILKEKLNIEEDIEIISLTLLDRKEFLKRLEDLKKDNKILSIVGTIDIDIPGVPFISAHEIIAGNGIERLREIIDNEVIYDKIGKSLGCHLENIDSSTAVSHIRKILNDIQSDLNVVLSRDVLIGIILHMSFMLQKIKEGKAQIVYKNKEELFKKYSREYNIVERHIKSLENIFNVEISSDEICYLVRTIIKNSAKFN